MGGKVTHSRTIGPAATVLLAFGLLAAVALDGWLPTPGTYALFAALATLDGLMIAWLTRSRGA